MATYTTHITITRADRQDSAVIQMTTPEGASGQVILDEQSDEYGTFCDAVDAMSNLVFNQQ